MHHTIVDCGFSFGFENLACGHFDENLKSVYCTGLNCTVLYYMVLIEWVYNRVTEVRGKALFVSNGGT